MTTTEHDSMTVEDNNNVINTEDYVMPDTNSISTEMNESQRLEAKVKFRTIWLAFFLLVVVSIGLQFGFVALAGFFAPALLENTFGVYFLSFAPIYLFAAPAYFLVIRRLPAVKYSSVQIKGGNLWNAYLICLPLMYLANIIGIIVNFVVSLPLPATPESPIAGIMGGEVRWLVVLVTVILAPIIEELLFRKLLIDRIRVYGERFAILFSALLFALFHGNLLQVFYAFVLGIIFGYVYYRSGNVKKSILLHMIINAMGTFISFLLTDISTSALQFADTVVTDPANMPEGYMAFGLKALLFIVIIITLIVFVILGIIKFFKYKKQYSPLPAALPLPKKSGALIYENVFSVLALIGILFMFLINLGVISL